MPNVKSKVCRRTCARCGVVFRWNDSLEGQPGEIDFEDDETIHFLFVKGGQYLSVGVSVVVPAPTEEAMLSDKVFRETRCITCDESVVDDIHARNEYEEDEED